MHKLHFHSPIKLPLRWLLSLLLLFNDAWAQPETCSKLASVQYRECEARNEAALIKQWPQYFRRSAEVDAQVDAQDSATAQGARQTLTILPRSGNSIALTSYFPAPDALDESQVIDYRLRGAFTKLDLAHVSAGFYESVGNYYYRLANGEQIASDGAPLVSPSGARLLTFACGESVLGKIDPVFDIYEMQGGWLKRVYQLPAEIYDADWCPEDVRWLSNNEITFHYVQSFYTSKPKQSASVRGLLRRLKGRWQLLRRPGN
jgi:hypothetical protein